MSNFSTKLENQSDDQLRNIINEESPNFASLASDEITRRELKKLGEIIKKSGKQEEKFSYAFLAFAVVQMIVVFLQFLFEIQNSTHQVIGIFLFLVAVVLTFYTIKKFISGHPKDENFTDSNSKTAG